MSAFISPFRLSRISLAVGAVFASGSVLATDLQSEILNPQGQPMAQLEVRLLTVNGKQLANSITDAQGVASFGQIDKGHYLLQIGNHALPQHIDVTAATNQRISIKLDANGKLLAPDSLSRQPEIATVEVTSARLKSAQIDLSPRVGTTIYSVDKQMIDNMGMGDSAAFNDILVRLPGVAQDSKGSGGIHVRDDHGNVQYRINGVQLPESISGFGQSIDTRQIDSTDFMTGALPAQFGLRTAGIIDIQTKEGHTTPGGQIGVLVGSNHYFNPSAQLFGTQGAFNYYVSGSFTSNQAGIENPTPSLHPIHDKTEQYKGFANLSYYLDDDTRLGLMAGSYSGKFQIPNNPNQTPGFSLAGVADTGTGLNTLPSASLNENQNETNRFLVLSYQKTQGAWNYQVSAFRQYSELHYLPDYAGDLIYNGVASDVLRSNSSGGVQADLGYKLNLQHTLRAGLSYMHQITHSNNLVSVFPTDSDGNQSSNLPQQITDFNRKSGHQYSLYVQDEWHPLEALTVNYGVRYDQVSSYVDEQQWSPRLNLAYQINDRTAVHAGYSRYFTPPPQELASQDSINLYSNTTNAPKIAQSDNVKSERTHYFDIGISHKLSDQLTLTADTYYKKIRNMLDEGQFGQALILSPFNYDKGYAKGLELSAIYNQKNWGGYLNVAVQKAQGSNIISGQSLFGPDELAYIASHYVYVDHDQTYTISAGGHYQFGDSQVSADLLYGSGLRRTPDGGAPNSGTLPAYTTVNAGWTHKWKKTSFGDLEARLSVINLFDKVYLLRDGSGIGVGAPQYGARRSLYAGISLGF